MIKVHIDKIKELNKECMDEMQTTNTLSVLLDEQIRFLDVQLDKTRKELEAIRDATFNSAVTLRGKIALLLEKWNG